MSTNLGVNTYRTRHKRCRTCTHSSNNYGGWFCNAKQKAHIGNVQDTMIAGCFCNLYDPILEKVIKYKEG